MNESIGSTLKQRREARHLSIEQVAEQTRVRVYYLQALENDDLSAIPSMVQARGFLRIYADFLGLNLDNLSVSRTAELQPPVSSVAASPESISTPASSNVSTPDSSRPGFLGGLRDRFARHPATEAAAPETEPVTPSEPGPEEFVPVRVHEELPAAPEEPVLPEPVSAVASEPDVKPARARKTSSRKTATKKPVRAKPKKKQVTKTKSSKAGADTKVRVKKKITKSPSRKKALLIKKKKPSTKKPSRTKRASSPRKLSSSRPRRRLAKPIRKSNKPKHSPQTKLRKAKRPASKQSRK